MINIRFPWPKSKDGIGAEGEKGLYFARYYQRPEKHQIIDRQICDLPIRGRFFDITLRDSTLFSKISSHRNTHFNSMDNDIIAHFNICYPQKTAPINRPRELWHCASVHFPSLLCPSRAGITQLCVISCAVMILLLISRVSAGPPRSWAPSPIMAGPVSHVAIRLLCQMLPGA